MSIKTALARGLLIASILAGVSYIAIWDRDVPQAVEVTWKGLGVGLLAVYAAVNARNLDGWLLTAVMTLGALGDVLLDAVGLAAGAVVFLVGHLVAIGLYLRNRRPAVGHGPFAPVQKFEALILFAVVVPLVVAVAFQLPADRATAPGVALYCLGLVAMTACAWLSRFPRNQVGLGAVMFVVSDLLIFGRGGPWPENFTTDLAVWGLYYGGQLLICVGVAGHCHPAADRPASPEAVRALDFSPPRA